MYNTKYSMKYMGDDWHVCRANLHAHTNLSDGTAAFSPVVLKSTIVALPVAPWLRRKVEALPEKARTVCEAIQTVGLFLLFLVAISFVVKNTYNPFIYFNF